LGEEVFTTDQVAHDLNLSVKTILRAIKSGRLQARKAGKQFLITRAAVRAYYEGLPLTGGKETDKET
jgi:excisionase family DNA binding protein